MSSILPFVKKREWETTSGMIVLFGLKNSERLAKLGRERGLRQFFYEFLPEARVTE